jgi:menaquinone-specific isochorismate synthase
MIFLPYGTHPFQNSQELYQFLFACKQIAIEHERTHIVSLSFTEALTDPLAVLYATRSSHPLHFYLEKQYTDGRSPIPGTTRPTRIRIGALGAAAYLKTEGPNRFRMAREFIDSCLAHILIAGELSPAFAGPHFLGSFSFFDDCSYTQIGFPAATIFLPRWQITTDGQQSTLVANCIVSPDSNLQTLTTQLWQDFQTILKAGSLSYEAQMAIKPTQFSIQTVVEADQFNTAVCSALAAIHTNYLHKIVLSHAIDVMAPSAIAWGQTICKLRTLNPDCYLFSVSNGQGQTFIGASPERLLSLHDSELVTDALAGSAPRGKTPQDDVQYAQYLLSNPKELHEHQLVIDFIQQQLYRLGLEPNVATTHPQLLRLSNIQHLRTPIQARIPPHVHLFDILAELHPTPAVAGTPRELACQEIRHYEQFERGLFAAPLGWVDYQGNGEFVVGIRSALIDGCQARLYAGAGIVAGSNPDQEFAEIQLKLQALLKALS